MAPVEGSDVVDVELRSLGVPRVHTDLEVRDKVCHDVCWRTKSR